MEVLVPHLLAFALSAALGLVTGSPEGLRYAPVTGSPEGLRYAPVTDSPEGLRYAPVTGSPEGLRYARVTGSPEGLRYARAPETFVRAPLPVTQAEAYELLTSPMRHVRALDPRLQEILEGGVDRAPTVGHLLAALQQSDVIVQIVPSSSMPLSTPARLLLVPQPKLFRFLRIEIRMEGTDDDLVAVLGHELRHALEIADAPDVRDDRTLIALYRRIGHRDGGDRQFDSQAAHDTANQIRRELYATAANALR